MAEQDRKDAIPSVLNDLIDVDGEPTEGDGLTYTGGAWRPTPGLAEVTYYKTTEYQLSAGDNHEALQGMSTTNFEDDGVFTNTEINPAPLVTENTRVDTARIDTAGWYNIDMYFVVTELVEGDFLSFDQDTGYDSSIRSHFNYNGLGFGGFYHEMTSGLIHITAGDTIDGFYRYYLTPTITVSTVSQPGC